jgi:hypothetical protein
MNANLNSQPAKSPFANPWVQLILGVICMASVANLQYGWTLFVNSDPNGSYSAAACSLPSRGR